MIYDTILRPDGTTERRPCAARFIVNDTPYIFTVDNLELITRAWERSPYPPTQSHHVLTLAGLEHARQQLLKEQLRESMSHKTKGKGKGGKKGC